MFCIKVKILDKKLLNCIQTKVLHLHKPFSMNNDINRNYENN